MKKEIQDYLNKILPSLISLRRKIHEYPELSNEERKTSKLVYDVLEENGIKAEFIESNIGVTALINGAQPGPTIAYRADIDALPMMEKTNLQFASKITNCMHACGHDIHTTVLLGTALIINKFKDLIKGNLRLIFQSGEETFTGANIAVKKGVLKNPKVDYVIALHTWPDLPTGKIGLKKGPMMAASSNVNLKIKGKGGHAAHPDNCIDPVIVSSYILTAVQSIVSRNVAPEDSAVITFGSLTSGSTSNIIPDYATAKGTVRTLDSKTDKVVKQRLINLVEAQARGFGALAEVDYYKICGPIINDPYFVDLLEKFSDLSIGRDNIVWLDKPSMGSEDFAYYLEEVPGGIIRLGTSNELEETKLPLHNSSIVFDEGSIEVGIKFMTTSIMSIIEELSCE